MALGSSDILGNPNHISRSFYSGFRELTIRPMEGFKEGLVEGSRGVVLGGKGLL